MIVSLLRTLLTFLLLCPLALAEGEDMFRARTRAECRDVDVLQTMSPELKEFFSKPRYQGHVDSDPKKDQSVGDCFAIGAADILSYVTGTPVSALHLFFKYEQDLDFFGRAWRWLVNDHEPEIFDGGFVNEALTYSLKKDGYGICPESVVASSHPELVLPNVFSELKLALSLAKEGKPFRDALESSQVQQLFPSLAPSPAETFDRIERELASAAREDQNMRDLLARLSDLSCQDRMIQTQISPDAIQTHGHDDSDVLTPIDRQLDHLPRPNLPSILYDTGYTRVDRSPMWIDHWIGTHVSTITARRFNEKTGTCEYRVRDSLFGTSCESYKAKYVTCNGDGTFWVSDRTLWEMTAFTTSIDPE